MDNISFECDDSKNQINLKKHHISFAEAMSVFYDDYAIVFDDPDHFRQKSNQKRKRIL